MKPVDLEMLVAGRVFVALGLSNGIIDERTPERWRALCGFSSIEETGGRIKRAAVLAFL